MSRAHSEPAVEKLLPPEVRKDGPLVLLHESEVQTFLEASIPHPVPIARSPVSSVVVHSRAPTD